MDDLTIEIDDEPFAKLPRRAEREGCDVEELARRLILEHLSENGE